MGKAVRTVVGVVATVTGVAIGVFTGNWTLAFAVASLGVGMLTAPKAQDIKERQGAVLQNRVGGTELLPVVYGMTRIGGVVVDVRVDSASTERKRLVVVIAYCHGSRDGTGITSIEDVRFDDRTAIVGGAVQSPFSGVVPGQGATKYLEFAHYLGTSTQAVDARLNSLFPTEWPSTSQGRGVCYGRYELWYNQDIYPSSIPAILAKVKGNSVYDPRSSTWAWSANPALCIRDYLLSTTYGMGVAAANIEEQSFIDAANYCDELIAKPGGGTQVRFALNGWVDTSRSVEENLALLCTACRGQVVNEGDKWRLIIRCQRTVSGFKVTEKNTVEGSWQFVLPGARDAANIVRAQYVDPARNYEADVVQWPEAGQSNPYLTEDNSYEQRLEVDLPFTDDRLRAQQIGMTLLKEGREAIAVTCTLKEEALQVRVGDLVEVTQPTPGWVDKVFDVAALLVQPDGEVRAVLIEYEPTVYDVDTQFVQPAISDTNLPNPFTVVAPTSLVLVSSGQSLQTADGRYLTRIKATWTKSADAFVEYYEVQAKRTADSLWDSYGRIGAGEEALFFVYPVTDESWDVRVSAVNTLGVRSTWLSGTHSAGTPIPQPGAPAITASFEADGDLVVTLNATEPWPDTGTPGFRVAASTSAVPSDATVDAATFQAGSSVTVNLGGGYVPGTLVYIAAAGYTATSGGVRSLTSTAQEVRQGTGTAGLPLVEITPVIGSRSQTNETVQITGYKGKGGTDPLEYQYRLDADAWSTWAALGVSGSTVSVVVAKAKFYDKEFQARVRDAVLNESIVAIYMVIGQFESLDVPTGRVDKGTPYHTGEKQSGAIDTARSSGLGRGIVDAALRRGGIGGTFTRLASFLTMGMYGRDGSRLLVNSELERVTADLDGPTGVGMDVVERGGNKGDQVIDAGNVLNANTIDFTRAQTGKNLANIEDDATSDRRAATATEKTGGSRASSVIDAGLLIVTNAIDFARSQLNKHLGNIADDATTDRKAVTTNEKTGAGRAYPALDSTSKLVTGVTAAATAADGLTGITSKRAAVRAGAGASHGVVDANARRRGEGGTAAASFSTLPVYDDTGAAPLINTLTDEVMNARIASSSNFENPGGTLGEGVQQTAAGASRALSRGYQSGFVKDTGVVTFNPAFQGVPSVRMTGGKAANATYPYDDVAAENLTASSFTCRARNRNKGTVTARDDEFTSPLSVTTAGSTVGPATLADAPSNDSTYKARYKITVACTTTSEAPAGGTTAVVAVESSSDAGSTWTERATRSHSVSRTTAGTTSTTFDPIEVSITVTGLDSTDKIRLKLKDITVDGFDTLGTATLEGFDFSPTSEGHGVTYNTATGSTSESKTPDADDYMFWEAEEKAAA